MRITIAAALVLCTLGACRKAAPPPPPSAPPVATWEGKSFRKGDTIIIMSWAGTIKPEESGYPVELDAGPFQKGTVLRGEKRAHDRPGVPIQVVAVRWAPQQWKVHGSDRRVQLGAFVSTIHVDYLEVTR
jgi:hypothetical protein